MTRGTGSTLSHPVGPEGSPAVLLRRLSALQVFGPVLGDPPGRAFRALLRAWAAGRPEAAASASGRLFRALAAEGWAGPAWAAHVAAAVLADANPWSCGPDPGPGLRAAAEADLRLLGRLAAGAHLEAAAAFLEAAGCPVALPRDLGPRRPGGPAAQLLACPDWGACADLVREAALRGGAGPYGASLAYRWEPRAGRLLAVPAPDLPPEDELCGYEAERAAVAENTERFLRGLPAQDALLYGDRGTGKSTAVRALLRRYGGDGLRLVQVDRRALPSLPALWDAVEGWPQRFIAFVDDLSFEDGETEFKDAKVALQGGLRARPRNALVYATSNRRHLVRERFAPEPEARPGDAAEERLSLADRFGLTVVFAAPDQELYLRIASHLAGRRGLGLPEAELRRRALRFALWQGGRSGRTARQFVDALEAGMAPGT